MELILKSKGENKRLLQKKDIKHKIKEFLLVP